MTAQAKTAKAPNYNAEQTAEIVSTYVADKSQETVVKLAEKFGKSVKSIVAKLVVEKVYVAKVYKTKTGEAVVKKDEHADAIGAILRLSEPEIDSLTKANKSALAKIFAALANSKPIDGNE
jgi:response regulator RpfG family c-di-GMP phosphodiesterase